MEKIPEHILKDMWQYILTTSAVPKLLEIKLKEREDAKSSR